MADSRSTKRTQPTGLTPMQRYAPYLAYGSIFLVVIAFFADALFGGKNFMSGGDNVAFYSFVPYLDAAKQSGEFPLWMPYIFGGMPSLASFLAAGDRTWDFVGQALFAIPRGLGEATSNDTTRLVLWYIIYAWGVYTLCRVKGLDRSIGVFSAIGAVLSTFVIVWIMIGHSTKPVSMATLPWILLALERLRERFTLANLFLLILPLIVLVSATHPQMMFYIGCATALYMVVELATRIITRSGWVDVLKAGGGLAIAGIIALGTHADMFLATRQYTAESTRGSAPLVQSAQNSQDQSGGNDYEYATNWSFSPGEMYTFIVPSYFGFGNTTIKTSRSAPPQRAMLYWGQMPFTDAANYMGIAVLVLGLVGMLRYRRDPFVIFLTVLSVFALLLSMGKNFPVLYDIFFNTVPAFNKFRAPSMALCLLQFALPVLAGYGLTGVLSWAKEQSVENRRAGLWVFIATAVVAVMVFLVASDESDYKREVDASFSVKQGQSAPAEYLDIVYNEMHADSLAAMFYLLVVGGLVVLTARGVVKPTLTVLLFIGLLTVDLWRVDRRPYEPKKGSPEQNVFAATDMIGFLKTDKSIYRICDLREGVPANWWAYHFIESVGGYSSAKMRVYQDMLDVAAPGPGREPVPGNSLILNPFLWNLLNVKYIVSYRPLYPGVTPTFQSQETGALVYENTDVLPRAWFVDTVRVESNRRKLLELLRDGTFDARRTAYVEQAFDGMGSVVADTSATARVTEKSNHRLAISTTSQTQQLLVVSEMFYSEWKAYVDGQPVETIKTNFLLRGIAVPAGTHSVEFRFESPAFENGRTISLAANGITLLIGLGGLLMWSRERRKPNQA
ncbi:MAG: YfhO family protein [Candidatus Kapabacteria bacterium]|nr:YfhO family protein [Candidatus Kapabacteria bacterium]